MILGQCADTANCVGIEKTWATIMVYGLGTGMVLFILLIWIIWKTPALEFLMAIITNRSLIYVTNRSQTGKFYTAKPNSEGILTIGKLGPFLISENSHTNERVSGRPLYIAFGEFASTLPMWWIQSVNYTRSWFFFKKKPIYNIQDLGNKIGMKFNTDTGGWEHNMTPNKEEITAQEDIDKQVKVMPRVTIKLHDLANMFPFNITPALIESRVTHALAKKQKFWNTLNPQFMMYAGVFLIIAVIGGYMAFKFFGGGTPKVTVFVDQAGRLISANSSMVA